MRRVATGLAARGVTVVTFDFRYMEAGRKAPDRAPVLEAAFADAWRHAVAPARPGTRLFAGGKSMGGRIASQAAARGAFDPRPDGLVFFGYPLHPPGQPDRRRDAHLPGVRCPMIFLHGTRDPFGTPDEMADLSRSLPRATLHVVEAGDHSLVATKTADPDGTSVDRAVDAAAAWMLGGG